MPKAIRRGTDSSGRAIYATPLMWAWWDEICDDIGFKPEILQGAFQRLTGNGAAGSAGYHDGPGCLDWDARDLTEKQNLAVVDACRERAGAAWVRDPTHGGFTLRHGHLVFSGDPLEPGPLSQWREYLANGDGITGNGRDYHRRPDPLVTEWHPMNAAKVAKALREAGDAEQRQLARMTEQAKKLRGAN